MIKIKGEVIINNEKEWNDDLIPSNHSSHNLGSSSKRWSNLYMQGTAYISGSASVGSNELAGGYVSGDYFSATNAGDSSSSKVLELGYYDFYVDNTGAGSHNSRLWINAPAGGEVVIGPRGGGDWLDNLRLRALEVGFESNQINIGGIAGTTNLHMSTNNDSYISYQIGGRKICPLLDTWTMAAWGYYQDCPGTGAEGWTRREHNYAAIGSHGNLTFNRCYKYHPACLADGGEYECGNGSFGPGTGWESLGAYSNATHVC